MPQKPGPKGPGFFVPASKQFQQAYAFGNHPNRGGTMASTAINPVRAGTSYFHVWMAAVCVLLAFGGFAPTYWLQLPAGTFVGSPLVHLHAILFSAWPLFLLSQTLLVANGRLSHHRAWGLFGISLALRW